MNEKEVTDNEINLRIQFKSFCVAIEIATTVGYKTADEVKGLRLYFSSLDKEPLCKLFSSESNKSRVRLSPSQSKKAQVIVEHSLLQLL